MPAYKIKLGAVHADYFRGCVLQDMTKTEASKAVKGHFELPHTVASISRTLPDLVKELDSLPDVPNLLPPELIVPYQDCMILGDCHAPYINKKAFVDAMTQAKERGLKVCILNGDFIDADWASHWETSYVGRSVPETERARRVIYEYLRVLYNTFDIIYVVLGNHDYRIIRKLDGAVPFSSILQMYLVPSNDWRDKDGSEPPNLMKKFTITERYYMIMEGSPVGDWRYSHQKGYSKIPGRVAIALADKYNVNVVSGHSHHLFSGVSTTMNPYLAIEGGSMFDQKKVEYKCMRDSAYPSTTIGWVTVEGGMPQLYQWEMIYREQIRRGE